MAEEPKKEPEVKEEPGLGSKILDVAGRVAEGAIDGLAASRPIIGMPLQAAFNTEEYQLRQDQRKLAKAKLARAMQENEEWNAAAGIREKQRQVDEQNLNDALSPEAKKSKELARKAQDAANQHVVDTAPGKTEAAKDGMAEWGKQLRQEISNKPGFNMNIGELDALMQSPEIQHLLEAKYYKGLMQQWIGGDAAAGDRLQRMLDNNGWSIKDNDDGTKVLVFANGAESPITYDSISAIDKQLHDAARTDIEARNLISQQNISGQPGLRSIGKYAGELMKVNGGSAASAVRDVQDAIAKASDGEKGYFFFNQALSDFYNSNLPADARLAGLKKCIPFLAQFGLTYEAGDAANPDPNNVRIVSVNGGNHPMSLMEFYNAIKDKDTLGKRLDAQVGFRQYNAIMTALRQRNYPLARAYRGDQPLKVWGAANGQQGGKGNGEDGGGNGGNGGNGENGGGTELDPEVRKQQARMVRRSIIKYSPEERLKIVKIEKNLNADATDLGILIEKDGKLGIDLDNPDTQRAVKDFAQQEDEEFKKAKMQNLCGKGYWSRQLQLIEAKKKKKEGQAQEAAGKRLSSAAEGAKLSPWAMGFGDPMTDAGIIGNIVGILGRGKQQSAEDEKQKASLALGRQGQQSAAKGKQYVLRALGVTQ